MKLKFRFEKCTPLFLGKFMGDDLYHTCTFTLSTFITLLTGRCYEAEISAPGAYSHCSFISPALLIAVTASITIALRLNAPATLPCHNIAYSPDTCIQSDMCCRNFKSKTIMSDVITW